MAKVYKRAIISETLCISEKRVKQLTEQGVLKEEINGHYSLMDSVQNYIKYLQNQISDRNYTSDYNTEKAMLTKAKREKEEAELLLLKGDLHKSEDIEFVLGNMLIAFKAKLLTLPHKAVSQITEHSSKNDIIEILTNEVLATLTELSEYGDELFNKES